MEKENGRLDNYQQRNLGTANMISDSYILCNIIYHVNFKQAYRKGKLFVFRKCLFEPRDMLLEALDLLKDETHDQLPEGQLRLQVKDTLTQLEQFIKTLGCEM